MRKKRRKNLSHRSNRKKNKKIEQLEENALKSEAKDFFAESAKEAYAFSGHVYNGTAIPFGISGLVDGSPMALYWASWGILRGGSFQVMRAEYLPPRKNVLSRAKDQLIS